MTTFYYHYHFDTLRKKKNENPAMEEKTWIVNAQRACVLF